MERVKLPIPPKGMNRKDAYHFRLTHYHTLLVKGIGKFKQKYNGRLPSSEQELVDILGLNRRTISLWLKRINKAGLLPDIRLMHYHQLLTEAVEKYKKEHHGRLPPSYPILAEISGVSPRTIFTWVKKIDESGLLPKIEKETSLYRLTYYARLFKKIIKRYQTIHKRLPTEQEIAEILKVHQTVVSRWMRKIKESGLFPQIKTRATPQKRKIYIADEEIVKAYSDFVRKSRYRKVPSQIQLGHKLKVHHTTLSRRLKKLSIKTKGMSPKKKRRYINDKEFMRAFNTYQERHRGILPSQRDLARMLGVDQLVISYRLLRMNIENLAETQPFIRTRGFRKLIPRRPKRFVRFTSPSPRFENLEDAVGDICSRIDRVLGNKEEIENLTQFSRVKSTRLITSFLLASKKALERYIRDGAFFITPRSISGPKGEVITYCEGNKFYIYQNIIDPESKRYEGLQFLASNIFEALLTSLFVKSSKSSNFPKEMQEALFTRQ